MRAREGIVTRRGMMTPFSVSRHDLCSLSSSSSVNEIGAFVIGRANWACRLVRHQPHSIDDVWSHRHLGLVDYYVSLPEQAASSSALDDHYSPFSFPY